jgi:hypothetical protein
MKRLLVTSFSECSVPRLSRRFGFIRAIADILHLAVFFLQLSLHFEISLSFSLDTLLFHISYDALVHCLSGG